jgi:hypothetical protein
MLHPQGVNNPGVIKLPDFESQNQDHKENPLQAAKSLPPRELPGCTGMLGDAGAHGASLRPEGRETGSTESALDTSIALSFRRHYMELGKLT